MNFNNIKHSDSGGGMFGINDNEEAVPAGHPHVGPQDHHQPQHSSPKDDLLQIKRQALQSLAPMVNQLDQEPEEKFKTLMMLIQASDNAELIKDAYAAAQTIRDEKERAQALIDVVNEINYFTQK